MVRGGPEVRFHEGSTRVPPKFHDGVVRELKRAPHAVGYHLSFYFYFLFSVFSTLLLHGMT